MLIVPFLNSAMYCYILLLTFVCEHVWAASSVHYELDNAKELFEEFIIKYDKNYFTEELKVKRFEIFKANLELINRMNEESYDAVFAITPFTDQTPEEVSARNGFQFDANMKICKILHDEDLPNVKAPESLDWRDFKMVTPVKDQGYCGSCWAFSVIGNIEGQYAKKHKQLVEFSEQQLIDCNDFNNGCCGGWPISALESVIDNKGINTEEDYMYEARDYKCRLNRSKFMANVTDCYVFDLSSQEKIKQALYTMGPLSIGINATGILYHFSGIISDDHCNIIPGEYNIGLNHAVVLVGYGTEKDKPYWIVKNSWGASWHEGGYFRMQRNDASATGACGLVNPYICTGVVA